ncbi:irregular chiasm C-roughest protein isoform X2 [Bemisia tabaci]|uniref:irregular chiasm C-roughest protein isoform X2 n=1 Tax=Bemisia tabaci TaxID=7038 RepID=UPI003B28B3DB
MELSEFIVRITFIFCCSIFKDVMALQQFDRQPIYTEVNPGEDKKLDCIVLNKRGSCSWQKDNKPVGIYAKKYEWAGRQEDGDCSLWIRQASLDFDDGAWECQVTASDFITQDALTSNPVRLVVRVAPQRPRIEYNASHILPNHNITVRAGNTAVVKCISRYGNPPAKLKWLLGDQELVPRGNQTNVPEADNNRTWVASSVLETSVEKIQHGRILRCVAIHESYPAKSQSIEVRLDVTYPPEVRLTGTPTTDIEEGKDVVALRCITDANPPATVQWRRSNGDIRSTEESFRLAPVNRKDSGVYTCQASNNVGTSQPLTVSLDVKYAPSIREVGPDKVVTAPLFSPVRFNCEADGNPLPSYQWLQRLPTITPTSDETVYVRGSEAQLYVNNVTYDHQGDYVCRVTNSIGGSERSVQSQAISVQVVGAPQVVRNIGGREVVARRGEDALLKLVVCADPRPRRAAWHWGSLQLEAGAGQGRYQAENLIQDTREDCYEARFHVREVSPEDSRNYYLEVHNDRGTDRHSVRLAVRGSYAEPLTMVTLLSVTAAAFLVLLVAALVLFYIIRTEKCCFGNKFRRGDFRPTDLESEKSDIDSNTCVKTPRIESSMITSGPMSIPGEAMYCSSPARRPPQQHIITAGGSPEAMKQRRHHGSQQSHRDRERERDSKKRSSAYRSSRESLNMFADLQQMSSHHSGGGEHRHSNHGGGSRAANSSQSRMNSYSRSQSQAQNHDTSYSSHPDLTSSYYYPKQFHLTFPHKPHANFNAYQYDNMKTVNLHYSPNSFNKAEI